MFHAYPTLSSLAIPKEIWDDYVMKYCSTCYGKYQGIAIRRYRHKKAFFHFLFKKYRRR